MLYQKLKARQLKLCCLKCRFEQKGPRGSRPAEKPGGSVEKSPARVMPPFNCDLRKLKNKDLSDKIASAWI